MIEIPGEMLTMDEIPVEFELAGRSIKASLSFVHGRAGYTWSLHSVPVRKEKAISYWHYGHLYLQEGYEWMLRINNKSYPELAKWFEAVLISWYQ